MHAPAAYLRVPTCPLNILRARDIPKYPVKTNSVQGVEDVPITYNSDILSIFFGRSLGQRGRIARSDFGESRPASNGSGLSVHSEQ